VGTDASAVELARGEVGELVAEDFFEESVVGFLEEGGEADEAALGIAAAEASGQAGGPLDGGSGSEVGRVPEMEPAVGCRDGFGREGGVHGLGAKANTKDRSEVRLADPAG